MKTKWLLPLGILCILGTLSASPYYDDSSYINNSGRQNIQRNYHVNTQARNFEDRNWNEYDQYPSRNVASPYPQTPNFASRNVNYQGNVRYSDDDVIYNASGGYYRSGSYYKHPYEHPFSPSHSYGPNNEYYYSPNYSSPSIYDRGDNLGLPGVEGGHLRK
ncbi:MAG: hypothetical protein H0T62_07655 [Parachlamydiaceae bacterium]|nr:hypothetical protein [Parachlamydiaceae bacterium]